MRLAALLFLGSALGFAGNWSGILVDSKGYASEQSNVNKNPMTLDRDMAFEVRYCSPNVRTKAFSVVLPDWDSLEFDSAGNAKAAELARKTSKKSVLDVTVIGDLNKDRIKVASISSDR